MDCDRFVYSILSACIYRSSGSLVHGCCRSWSPDFRMFVIGVGGLQLMHMAGVGVYSKYMRSNHRTSRQVASSLGTGMRPGKKGRKVSITTAVNRI